MVGRAIHKITKLTALTAPACILLSLNLHAIEIKTCSCYKTKKLEITDFVKGEQIIPSERLCKEDHFVVGMKQFPEENVEEWGQYIYIGSLTCCKMCVVEKDEKNEKKVKE